MKSITVQSITEIFHLEVLAGANRMDRMITRPQTHRPGLEFVGYFDFSYGARAGARSQGNQLFTDAYHRRTQVTYREYRQISSAVLYCHVRTAGDSLSDPFL